MKIVFNSLAYTTFPDYLSLNRKITDCGMDLQSTHLIDCKLIIVFT